MSDSMTIKILNENSDIKINDWKEVTSVSFFVPNTTDPHPEGLFSNEIFGNPGTNDRKTRWGYISLNDYFMNPHCFYVFNRLKTAIATDIKQGLGRYYVDSTGELIKLDKGETVPANALYKEPGTGFAWLREAWPYISWRTTKDMTKTAKTRRKFLKMLDIDQVFMDKFPVMPAFYRDIDFKSTKRNKINTYYSSILRLANLIKNTSTLMFFDDDPDIPAISTSHVKMENVLIEFYNYFMDKLGGANGFVNDHVVGKTTDYGARLVITTPSYNCERYTDCEVDFFHSSVPLSIAINIFSPFIIFGLNKWIKNTISGRNYVRYYDFDKNEWVSENLDPTWLDEFSGDSIRKSLDLYKKSKRYRVRPVTLKGEDGKRIPITVAVSLIENNKVNIDTDIESVINDEDFDNPKKYRNLTYCELYYIIAMDYIKDKVIFNTRYPLTTYNGTYSGLMNIIPANKYASLFINGKLYPRYPIIQYTREEEIEHLFTDSMRMFSVYPSAMGADFDGDQISTQGVFTNEANDNCIKHMNEVSNVVGIDGKSIRELPRVVTHGIYGLTYMIPKPEAK